MKDISPKRRKRLAETSDFRADFRERMQLCEWCGKPGTEIHEIANGASRSAALDQLYAILLLCASCHKELHAMPKAAALAVLQISRPFEYSLAGYWRLIDRMHPDQAAVDHWVRRITKGERA